MNGNFLIIVALVVAAAAFVGILCFFSCRLMKLIGSIPKAEKRVDKKILVVDRPSTISNVKSIDFD